MVEAIAKLREAISPSLTRAGGRRSCRDTRRGAARVFRGARRAPRRVSRHERRPLALVREGDIASLNFAIAFPSYVKAEAPKAPELRDLRIQQKLANTAEARDSEQKPQQRAEAPLEESI